MVVYAYNPSTQEAEAGGSKFKDFEDLSLKSGSSGNVSA
jgi:hypothetical protein